MSLIFMIFIKESTNQIRVPRTRILADSAFSSGCMAVCMLTIFAPFLADNVGEEQDNGFLG